MPRPAPHLVRVNVVVQDQAGNPVPGLTPDDFILLDDGRPQAIQEFAAVTNQPVDQYTPSMEAGTYSNRFEDHPRVADSVIAVLLDGINTRFEDLAYARRQTVKFLEQIQPGDHVAVYVLGRELRTLLDFSSEASDFLAALKEDDIKIAPLVEEAQPRERLAYRLEAAPRGDDLLDAFLESGPGRSAKPDEDFRLRRTAQALAAIADHFGGLPGRKNLVWVSEHFPAGLHLTQATSAEKDAKGTLQGETAEAARALHAAGVAIYPVDARGMMPAEQIQVSNSLHAGSSETDLARREAMADLAALTGGRAFAVPQSIFGAVRAALDDSALSYQLGYYADAIGADGKLHSLAVSVRRVGMQVHVRRGYFDPITPQLTTQTRKAVLANAATSPLDATGIGLSVRVKAAGVPGTQALDARVRIGGQDLAFAGTEAGWRARLDIVFVQLDAKNRIVDSSDETFDLKLSTERLRQVQQDGLNYSKEISLQPDAATLRVLVRDATTGATGSLAVPLAAYFSRAGEAN